MKVPLFPPFLTSVGVIMQPFIDLLKKIEQTKSFTENDLKTLHTLFEDRFWKSLELAILSCVKKYTFSPSNRIVWIVSTDNKDYLTYDDFFCNCNDFYLNIVKRRNFRYCKHILAKQISISLNNYETIEIEDDRYDFLMNEWRTF